ncbi:MAG TPA: NAD(P)H-dependent glycerol-3-phosphate dehydrogenase [Burkholderiales bacterium]|nr:NAD(P)H-dependent glycerol-3-phosphate dehydrogenase [Burkholderiales bacterium]
MGVAVLGAGAWGTALAIHFAARHRVSLWVWDPAQLERMSRDRASPFLPGFELSSAVRLEGDVGRTLEGADIALVVTPTSGLRETLRRIAASGRGIPVIWACKGFEPGTAKFAHQVALEELGRDRSCGAFSGPSFALEVAQGLPTAVTLASTDEAFARALARELNDHRLRVYSSGDVIGVEVGGAVKNVIAIAAGISDGMGFGHNARAALVTRGLAEITRLGLKLGARADTFMGLAGVGDLMLTCAGDLSRNRRVGLALAAGKSLDAILAELGQVAEGVNTAREVKRLAAAVQVEMPITEAVCQILFQGISAGVAVEKLLSREPKTEGAR